MATPLYFPTPTSLLPNRLYRSMLNPNVYRGVSRTPPTPPPAPRLNFRPLKKEKANLVITEILIRCQI